MILKELHLTDALERISIFPPLTHNGEVRSLTWPQVINISKIRDIQTVGNSGLIKFENCDSTWWPDLMWPRHKNFTTDVKLIDGKLYQVWLRCSYSFPSYWQKTTRGAKMTPPPTRAKVNLRSIFYLDLSRSTCISLYAYWREEHDAIRVLSLSCLVQKLSVKNHTVQKRHLYLPWPLEANVLTLRHIWWNDVTGAFHEISFVLGVGWPSGLGSSDQQLLFIEWLRVRAPSPLSHAALPHRRGHRWHDVVYELCDMCVCK